MAKRYGTRAETLANTTGDERTFLSLVYATVDSLTGSSSWSDPPAAEAATPAAPTGGYVPNVEQPLVSASDALGVTRKKRSMLTAQETLL